MGTEVDRKKILSFWEKTPHFFHEEAAFPPGSAEYFQAQRRALIEQGFLGELDPRLFPERQNGLMLDLGCGSGFWTVEFLTSGKANNVVSSDLTFNALKITRQRLAVNQVNAKLVQADAESIPFAANRFGHVNCLSVIHYAPEPEKCLAEIARVLKPGGVGVISVYYRNIFLRNWQVVQRLGRLMAKIGAKFLGNQVLAILAQTEADRVVCLYDGVHNPSSRAFSQAELLAMINPYFEVEEIFFHSFPIWVLSISLPRGVHRWFDRNFPFMIFIKMRKKDKISQT